MKTKALTLGLIAMLLGGMAIADMIAAWRFDSNLNADFTAPGVTASAVGRIPGAFSDGFNRSGNTGFREDTEDYPNGLPINDTTISGALSGNNGYVFGRPHVNLEENAFTFHLGLDENFNLPLNTIEFDFVLRNRAGDHFRLDYSLSSDFSNPVTLGEAAGFLTQQQFDDTQTGLGVGIEADAGNGGISGIPSLGMMEVNNDQRFSANRFNFDLPANVSGGDTIYFRLHVGGSLSDNDAAAGVWLDNIVVTAIPEPGTLMLLGIAGIAGLIGFRRRR
ncbi:MAG: PEP-CTERM sorting domain-containing protein [Verrucomicrobia bacterium]|nr:PEP-CTERM sorting domain-containing protein [Verrucomicrobiota bacterium]MCH8514303.1 PEP-CTERM sorting domain-containing protein [Kiritimatiellia bacterium]